MKNKNRGCPGSCIDTKKLLDDPRMTLGPFSGEAESVQTTGPEDLGGPAGLEGTNGPVGPEGTRGPAGQEDIEVSTGQEQEGTKGPVRQEQEGAAVSLPKAEVDITGQTRVCEAGPDSGSPSLPPGD